MEAMKSFFIEKMFEYMTKIKFLDIVRNTEDTLKCNKDLIINYYWLYHYYESKLVVLQQIPGSRNIFASLSASKKSAQFINSFF